MEIIYHFVYSNSVLLLNGSFVQTAGSVRYEQSEPLFVTVLPLNAQYIQYTVQLLGGKAVSNAPLTYCCNMGNGHYYVELLPRSAYVYSPEHKSAPEPTDAPNMLLNLIKSGNIAAARSLLTPELSESISGESLADFFKGVVAVRPNTFTPEKGYLLIKEDSSAPIANITYRNGLIDDRSTNE